MLLKVFMSASRDVVRLIVASVLPPTLSPHPIGRPFRSSRIPPLVGRFRVTTGQRSYEGLCGGAMAIVVKANMLFGGDASLTINYCLQLVQGWCLTYHLPSCMCCVSFGCKIAKLYVLLSLQEAPSMNLGGDSPPSLLKKNS